MSRVLVAKQPILDRQRKLYAYELLYRSDRVNQLWDGDRATVEVVINAFLNIGIDQIAGHYPVFITSQKRYYCQSGLKMSRLKILSLKFWKMFN
ncbi:hypothetical protein [Halolactibacillus sp. JCM 19043]|uniref:hypothetical protein n=1 Tax=Halolactibacillus sp. JCM 19043 TaxID=1460638 RepID=UPI0012E1EA9A|nr:hypothetical protein [Halolactibacillus sp. JCM 19043]